MTAIHVFIRLYLPNGHRIGPGKIALLEAIRTEGSITAAARYLGMSYRRAWELVEELNATFGRPLVESRAGGKAGGGADLTPLGYFVIGRYRAIQKAVEQASHGHLSALQAEIYAKRR